MMPHKGKQRRDTNQSPERKRRVQPQGIAQRKALAAVTITALLITACQEKPQAKTDSLTIYCAAGIRKPINELIEHFQQSEPGSMIQVNFGGSGTMLAQLELQRDGDLYVAADAAFMQQAKDRGLIGDWVTMAQFRPVLAVPEGNPAKINNLDDLVRDGAKFGIGDPTATAVGRLTKRMLERDGHWSALQPRIATTAATVNELATALAVGSLDAAIIWNSTANQNAKIAIATPLGRDDDLMDIPIAPLESAAAPELARKFIDLTVSDDGAAIFRKHHFDAAGGKPTEIVLFCGGSMRRPVEELLPRFEKQHNVIVHTQYNGCGILVGQMKAGMPGDVYYSCDQSFMDEAVKRGYCKPQEAVLTLMTPVIVTAKGNPKNIRTLEDLARPGVRVVLGNETHGAVGRTAYRLLEEAGLRDKVTPNIVKTAPTADLLLTDLAIGTADAGIIWDVVARGSDKRVEIIELSSQTAQSAKQPIAVMAKTKHPELSNKLVAYLRSDDARQIFAKHGFTEPPAAVTERSGARQ